MIDTSGRRAHTRVPLSSLLAISLFTIPAVLPAKIDLVTLPKRDSTQLTVYNAEDVTLVRESRTLSFSEGLNEIQFSWSGTLIDPTSLQISLPSNSGLTLLDAVYPKNTSEMIVWNIEAEEDSSQTIQISYFTSGMTWSANYVIKANEDETAFALQQFTKITNNSGEDFEDASTRVVVGQINLVEAIAELARRGIMVQTRDVAKATMEVFERRRSVVADELAFAAAPMSALGGRAEAAEIIKKAVSEYYLFAVEGKETIRNGISKELPNPVVKDVPFDLSYELDERRFGPTPVKFYKLKNETQAKLGKDPLPEGSYYIFADDGRDGLRFEGRTASKYIPIGEDIELNLGSDGRLLYEKNLLSLKRENVDYDVNGNVTGWEEQRSVQIELRNSRDRAVPVKLTEYLDGDWEFRTVSITDYDTVDRETVRWELIVDPQSKLTIDYTATVRFGTRARR